MDGRDPARPRRAVGTASTSILGALAWDIGDGIRIPPYARREDPRHAATRAADAPPLRVARAGQRERPDDPASAPASRGWRVAAGQALDRAGEPITFVVEPSPMLFLEIARAARALRRVCEGHGLQPAIHADVRVAAAADPVAIGHALIPRDARRRRRDPRRRRQPDYCRPGPRSGARRTRLPHPTTRRRT